MNILAPKIGALYRGLQEPNCDFLKMTLTVLNNFQSFMDTISLNNPSVEVR
jgi:hypothetical protein